MTATSYLCIVQIRHLEHKSDVTHFEVETDRDRRDFTMRDHSENCIEVSPFRYIFKDIPSNRSEIVHTRHIDRQSQGLLANPI